MPKATKSQKPAFNRKAFQKVLADRQDAYATAEASNSWTPEDGDYNVALVDARVGTYMDKKTKAEEGRLVPVYQILDGEGVEGRKFEGGFFSTARPGPMKAFLESILEDAADLPAAMDEIISLAKEGDTCLGVRVKTTVSERGAFTNTYVQEVLDTEAGKPESEEEEEEEE